MLEIRAKEVRQKVDLRRDRPVSVQVAGDGYELYYPSVTVSSADKATTNKAMLIVTRRR